MRRPAAFDALARPEAIGAVVLGAVSIGFLKSFVEGMFLHQAMWDVSAFVGRLLGALVFACGAVALAEKLRRSREDTGGVDATLAGLARTLLGVVLVAFLYCNVGPVRGVWHTLMRRVVTLGMARDLPPPPPPPAQPAG